MVCRTVKEEGREEPEADLGGRRNLPRGWCGQGQARVSEGRCWAGTTGN